MKIHIIVSFILYFISSTLLANDRTVSFNMTASGFAPFMFYDNSNKPTGILYDILELILKKHDYKVLPRNIPKNRELTFIDDNLIDIHAIPKELIPDHSSYHFSNVIINYKTVVFYLADSKIGFKHVDDLLGKRVITHLGFTYPPLEEKFKSNLIKRVDAKTEEAMLKMLILKRGDFAILNEEAGRWVIKQNNWYKDILFSPNALYEFNYRFLIAKRIQHLLPLINSELEVMKKNGTIKKIIEKYQ